MLRSAHWQRDVVRPTSSFIVPHWDGIFGRFCSNVRLVGSGGRARRARRSFRVLLCCERHLSSFRRQLFPEGNRVSVAPAEAALRRIMSGMGRIQTFHPTGFRAPKGAIKSLA